jgi:hypothetical protein
MPPDVRDYVTSGGRVLEYVDGIALSMDSFYEDGMILLAGKNILGTIDFDQIVVPVGMNVGSVVKIIFSEGVTSHEGYEIMQIKDHEAAIRKPGDTNWFWVPIDILKQGDLINV